MTRTVVGLFVWCKNKGSSISESCEEEEDAFSVAEPFVVAVEAIVKKKWRIFFKRRKRFLEKIEKA